MTTDLADLDPGDDWETLPGCETPAVHLNLTDLDLVAEVTHPIRGGILRHLKSPRTVADLADLLDAPITRLYHHVNRLTDLGLIRVVAVRRVAAVIERRYQVVAKTFRIDDELLTSNDPRELSLALSSLFDVAKLGFQRYVEAGGLGTTASADEQSTLSLGHLRLSANRRLELMAAIRDLIDSFTSDIDEDELDDAAKSRVTLFVAAYDDEQQ